VRYKYPHSRTNRIVMASAVAADALTVGGSLFELERWLHSGTRVGSLTLPLYERRSINLDGLVDTLVETIVYVLTETTRIAVGRPSRHPPKLRLPVVLPDAGYVCLFSGGVDSLSGILRARLALGAVQGVFCAHADQSKIIRIVDELGRSAFGKRTKAFRKVAVPPVGVHGYAQLRGFLYCLAGAAWMHLLQASVLIVTECGPTMYQPQFSPLDAVTMTTHPVVLKNAKAAIETVLGREIELVTPFEDMTKAEVMASCPRTDLLPSTHSCISQRFAQHDGTCYGCIIRRLGALAAGVPDVEYLRDPITDESANGGNLMSLLTYCHDVLTSYEDMEEFEVEKIERYKKHDLFRRFSLDHFAALHRLVAEGYPIRLSLRELYNSVVSAVGGEALDCRLQELRNFDPVIDWRRVPPA